MRYQERDFPRHDYADCVERQLDAGQAPDIAANILLAYVLQGCVQAHPRKVRIAMWLRNFLVTPWRLRRSPIGCPVSSLLDAEAAVRFAGMYPVREIVHDDAARAEVVLGADDRHLGFRTVIAVERKACGDMHISMRTLVQTRNRFGRIYMGLVDPIHRRWIAPGIVDAALAHACAATIISAYRADTPLCAVR